MSRAARTMRAARAATPTRSGRAVPLPVRRERLLAAIDSITADERLVLALLVYEGLTVAETSDLLGLPTREVERTCDRLMTELRRAMGGAPVRRRAVRPEPAAAERVAVRRAM